jgi:hypothetical protein
MASWISRRRFSCTRNTDTDTSWLPRVCCSAKSLSLLYNNGLHSAPSWSGYINQNTLQESPSIRAERKIKWVLVFRTWILIDKVCCTNAVASSILDVTYVDCLNTSSGPSLKISLQWVFQVSVVKIAAISPNSWHFLYVAPLTKRK